MNQFQNLRDQWLGAVAQDTLDTAKTAFSKILAEKPAELPPPSTPPTPPEAYQAPTPISHAPVPPPNTVAVEQLPRQAPMPPMYAYPPQPMYGMPTPYMPPPPPPRYKVDEEKMRSMAKWKATVNLKYVETAGRFARSLVGALAATNAMVEMVERAEKLDTTLTQEELAMIPTMRKAVEKRRTIEQSKTHILSDDDMRNIYEELIFQEMWDLNERGELRLEDPRDFLKNYILLTGAEIVESGKEVIVEKISGAVGSVKNKFSKKK